MSKVVSIFVIFVLAIHPLIFRNYYFDILPVKYYVYCGAMILMFIICFVTTVICMQKGIRTIGWKYIQDFFGTWSLKAIKLQDWAMLVFLITAIISTLQSEYIYESFWGNEGRYSGLFLILIYGISFFIISKALHFKQWYLDAFLIGGMFVCAFGIMHFFMLDPLGFKTGIAPDQYEMFTSTIGNINTYTSYVALVFGASVLLFSIENNRLRRFWYLLCTITSMFSLITGISDNAYLALLSLIGFLPLYLFNSIYGIKRYFLMLSLLFTEFQIIDYAMQRIPNHMLEINGLFEVVANLPGLTLVTGALWILSIALYILDFKLKKIEKSSEIGNSAKIIWLLLICLTVTVLVFVLIDVNIYGNASRYGILKPYLLIDDDWGTHRGYIWRIGLESYQSFPLIHKIFGFGPDTFGIVTVLPRRAEMISKYNEIYDSAHNEYLQYLITIGISGLCSYIAVLVLSIRKMVTAARKNPAYMAVVYAVICYGAQAFVNISVPIVTPIMLTLLMVGISQEN